ncbi:MAG: undecaprenyl diphosphate synthase family protein [Tannerellaceae bacterium]|jgi:undecaprenyl pyrophosphate synthase|nr:undecaprenyl diphosphate synthase family protein [Tannerellaceae bacterium]
MSPINEIKSNPIPAHISIIKNGSGRWAKSQSQDRSFEHQDGVASVQKTIEALQASRISDQRISERLCTKNIPDPDSLIRTAGKQRISDIRLWQMSNSELYFTDIFWPDFKEQQLYEAILYYQQRERRFGKTSEQLNLKKR